jgi:DNA-directed RNA polymerase III subunit RPC11
MELRRSFLDAGPAHDPDVDADVVRNNILMAGLCPRCFMLYCPFCYERVRTVRHHRSGEGTHTCFQCKRCGYQYPLPQGCVWTQPLHPWTTLQEKEKQRMTEQYRQDPTEQLLLGPEVPGQETNQVRCERCGNRRASFYQLQTRSADEPMTTFYRCLSCGNQWRD